MTKTFTPSRPIWCAGCGDFGVLHALIGGFEELGVPEHERFVTAGIGGSGTLQNDLSCYGYHTLHGRVLPTVTGAKLANPDLTVVGVGGDGDGYAIGGGHLMHAFKRNPGITYIVMNNGTYGLTKGQASPTAPEGWQNKSFKAGGRNLEEDFDPIMLGLSIPGSTYIARAYAGQPAQLKSLVVGALKHARDGKGMGYVEVLSPCVTYNDTYRDWRTSVYDVDSEEGYDPTNKAAAFVRMSELREEGRLPLGLIYEGKHPALEAISVNPELPAPALHDLASDQFHKGYEEALQSFIK